MSLEIGDDITAIEYVPNVMSIEGGFSSDDSDDDAGAIMIIGSFHERSKFSKSASTVEQNLRDMFGYVSVVKKQPKIKLRRKRPKKPTKASKRKHKPKILIDDAEKELADDFEVAKQIMKKKRKRKVIKGRGDPIDDNTTDISEFIID